MALGLFGFHLVLGIDDWAKRQHIVVQAALTTVIGSTFGTAGLWLINLFVDGASRTAHVSGLRLRLLPVPLSLVLYSLIFSVIFLSAMVYFINEDRVDMKTRLEKLEHESRSTGYADFTLSNDEAGIVDGWE